MMSLILAVFLGVSLTGPARAAEPWWRDLGDPVLVELIDEALTSSPDLLVAQARARQLDAVAWQVAAGLSPQVSFDVNGQLAPTSSFTYMLGGQSPGGAVLPDTYQSGTAQLSASWGVDLWGRGVLTWRASHMDALASQGDRDAAALSLATRVAQGWYDLVAAQARLDIAAELLATNQDALTLVQSRYEGGEAASFEVMQQRQQTAAARAQVPQARLVLRAQAHALAIVLGRPPTAELPAATVDFPELGPAPARPEVLDDRRPDLVAAARRVDGARAASRAAHRALLPTLGLSAQTGWQGRRFEEWDTQSTWSVGGAFSVPIFGGGATWAGIHAADAAEDAASRSLEAARLAAWKGVEDATAQEEERQAILEATLDQERAARAAYEGIRDRYQRGIADTQQLLSALSALQQAEQALVQARRDRLGARVLLLDALGGPWAVTGGPR